MGRHLQEAGDRVQLRTALVSSSRLEGLTQGGLSHPSSWLEFRVLGVSIMSWGDALFQMSGCAAWVTVSQLTSYMILQICFTFLCLPPSWGNKNAHFNFIGQR